MPELSQNGVSGVQKKFLPNLFLTAFENEGPLVIQSPLVCTSGCNQSGTDNSTFNTSFKMAGCTNHAEQVLQQHTRQGKQSKVRGEHPTQPQTQVYEVRTLHPHNKAKEPGALVWQSEHKFNPSLQEACPCTSCTQWYHPCCRALSHHHHIVTFFRQLTFCQCTVGTQIFLYYLF